MSFMYNNMRFERASIPSNEIVIAVLVFDTDTEDPSTQVYRKSFGEIQDMLESPGWDEAHYVHYHRADRTTITENLV